MELKKYTVSVEIEVEAAHAQKAIAIANRRLEHARTRDGIRFIARGPNGDAVSLVREGRQRVLKQEASQPKYALSAFMRTYNAALYNKNLNDYARFFIVDDIEPEQKRKNMFQRMEEWFRGKRI